MKCRATGPVKPPEYVNKTGSTKQLFWHAEPWNVIVADPIRSSVAVLAFAGITVPGRLLKCTSIAALPWSASPAIPA